MTKIWRSIVYVKLADWENRREEERRKLLMKEAELQQEGGGWAAVKKKPKRFLENLLFRGKSDDVKVGAGKWVSYLNRESKFNSLVGPRPVAPPGPKELYLYGNVGSGKTMLMDMLYAATEGVVKHRRRLHFHETVDVFAVIALSGILSRLLSCGTVLVATSNRAPQDLNQDGMQKELFLKMVDKLEKHCPASSH